jgi:hypothetical protein
MSNLPHSLPSPLGLWGILLFTTTDERKISLLLIDIFRRYFVPPIKATQEIGVALLYVRVSKNFSKRPI